MEKCTELFILICVLLCVSTEARQYTDDYCWRDYNGVIPLDAFEAGSDKDGRTLYIGQVLHESKIIPGKIYAGDNKVYFEFFDVEYNSSQNIKILCSRSRGTFQWIPTQHNQAHNLVPHNVLISGGFEAKCSTYLGRSKKTPGAEVGKVMCCEAADHCYGLYTTRNGVGGLEVEFDILAYNQNNNDVDYGVGSTTVINLPTPHYPTVSTERTSTTTMTPPTPPSTTTTVSTDRTTTLSVDKPRRRCKEITINMFY